jgi:hypothetical protein
MTELLMQKFVNMGSVSWPVRTSWLVHTWNSEVASGSWLV